MNTSPDLKPNATLKPSWWSWDTECNEFFFSSVAINWLLVVFSPEDNILSIASVTKCITMPQSASSDNWNIRDIKTKRSILIRNTDRQSICDK